MQPKAKTVAEYLASLPADRRAALTAVREVILKNLDADYREGMAYGMIGYCVPHEVFPAGYHCDPKLPLPFAGLASQKSHMSLHLMSVVFSDDHEGKWFRDAWRQAGKKLDMGKGCVRFRKLEDVPLDVLGEAFRRMPAKKYIGIYTQALASRGAAPAKPKTAAKRIPAKKPAAKKPANRAAAKTGRAPGRKKARSAR